LNCIIVQDFRSCDAIYDCHDGTVFTCGKDLQTKAGLLRHPGIHVWMFSLSAFYKQQSWQNHHQNCSKWRRTLSKKLSFKRKRTDEEECCLDDINENTETDAARISREMKTTVEAIAYIAEHMKAEMSDKKVRRIRTNRQ
ncbi:hypothetical protein ANCCAN_29357, partial [Ancylostoma caninum]